ncbi:Response regulator receiver domain-containing protein [Desulfonauticus submarinus]|uniref:Response regulator receiver domain-containing protein n=1 Tax=Desulfonauticus submarinus TaxID=206665 RepID=A0A1H0FL76_9BACT|nr:response regulator [Desulfonauticus submarinus]SDN95403.1 Response regulator receiver domain-containing protein [Desulfonauticus submarinus]
MIISTILIVDDEKDYLSALAERLELRGYLCLKSINGEQAIKIIKEKKPDLVLLDLKMPGISGIEVLKWIYENHPNLPVFIITGHGSTKEKELCLELGAKEYLNKPVDFQKLLQKIRELE